MKSTYAAITTLVLTTSSALADTDFTIALQSLDASITFGGATVSGDGTGFTSQFTHLMDNGIGFLGSYSSMNGEIGTATWSLTSTTLGIGYAAVDNLTGGSGARVIAGLGYTLFDGEVSANGTKTKTDGNSKLAVVDVTGRLNETISVSAGLQADLEGDVDPVFGVAINYDITDNGSMFVGYSSNSTTDTGVTTKLTGWTIGWSNSF